MKRLAPNETPCYLWKQKLIASNAPSNYILEKKQSALVRIGEYSKILGKKPFYVTNSFGKDSCVVRDLILESGVPCDIHHNITTCDPAELLQFGMKCHKETIVHKPDTSMFKLIEKKGVPPTRMVPYCCANLKERGGAGRIVISGIRHEESRGRSKRLVFENCYSDPNKKYFNPIIEWSESDVWEYIHSFKIPYCSLYDEGMRRIGCVLCPKSSLENRLWEMNRFKPRVRSYLQCFRNTLSIPHPNHKIQFKSEYDMLCWYVYGKFLRDVSNDKALIIMQAGEI